MTPDAFALLDQPRRPWLDADALKTAFHARVAREHPDLRHGDPAVPASDDAFAALNIAFNTLSTPRSRVRHLLELETGAPAARHQAVPDAIGALFTPVGDLQQRLAAFFKKRAAATSALAKALLAGEAYTLSDETEALLERLQTVENEWLDAVRTLDERWISEPDRRETLLAPLAQTAQALGYLEKWIAQVREGIVRLQLEE